MKYIDSIRRAGRSLKNAKARTLLTSLAIAVGSFTLTLSIAAGIGAREYADKLISSNVDPDALFIVKDKTVVGGSQPQTGLTEYDPDRLTQGGTTIKMLTQDDVTKLQARSDLSNVRPIYDVSATYVMFEGISKKYSASVNVYNPDVQSDVVSGTLPSIGGDIADNTVVIPSSFAETLGLSTEQIIGKKLTITVQKGLTSTDKIEQTFTVVASVAPSNLSFSDSKAIQIPITIAKKISDFSTQGTPAYQKYFAVTAKAKNSTPDEVKAALEKEGFYPQTAKDLQGFLFTIINTLQGIVAGFGALALIASLFGIINTQYISVLERTREIGLMKALGMRGRHVRRLFQLEAAWIGFLGGVLGALLAWGVGVAINPWLSEVMELGDNRILVFKLLPIAGLILGLILIAMIAGWFPSRKASKLDPIEALRTE